MMATLVLLLTHVPPVVTLLSVVLMPWHITNVPVIGGGIGLTVTTLVTTQPEGDV
jgi:hypothetical protein